MSHVNRERWGAKIFAGAPEDAHTIVAKKPPQEKRKRGCDLFTFDPTSRLGNLCLVTAADIVLFFTRLRWPSFPLARFSERTVENAPTLRTGVR